MSRAYRNFRAALISPSFSYILCIVLDIKRKMPTSCLALRMYTGPFYVPWNTALWRYKDDPSLVRQWGMCISVLYSAIFKLSFLSKKGKVDRGVNESRFKLPDSFVECNSDNFAAGVELALMSTSTDLAVAGKYASRGGYSLAAWFGSADGGPIAFALHLITEDE